MQYHGNNRNDSIAIITVYYMFSMSPNPNGVWIKYSSLRSHDGSSDCFTLALANLIALAGTLSLSRLSGSGIVVWLVEDDKDPIDLKYFRIPVWTNPALIWLDIVRSILRICKTLERKSLANQRSVHQIHQCFPPPMFHTIR